MPKPLDVLPVTLYRTPNRRGALPASCSLEYRAISSAVEHFVDIEGVTGSIPVSPTMSRSAYVLHTETKARPCAATRRASMKVRNSLRSLKNRHRDCRVVRRKGRVYVINKTQRRFKARQG